MFRLFHPHLYQGPRKLRHKSGYFEGWYYKIVSPDNHTFAIIPGVSLKKDESYAFIQTINGNTGETSFTTFSLSEFNTGFNPFFISIGDNHFSLDKLHLGDRIPLSGEILLINLRRYKTSIIRPGIMGWYRYVPFMECYHGIVSSGHGLQGELIFDSQRILFDEGRGYCEKDWGTSFPSSYIWMQSNSFKEKEHSFMLSVANIPWFGSFFRGFLGILDLGERIITFSTYTGARLIFDSQSDKHVSFTIEGRGFGLNHSLGKGERIIVRAGRTGVGHLVAPSLGSMERRIGESINSEIIITYTKNEKNLFEGSSGNSGLEVVGDMSELIN